MMSSSDEAEDLKAASPSPSSVQEELMKKDAAGERRRDEGTAATDLEDKENRVKEDDDDEEFSTSLSVGDGRYLVDLGSSSEFIVDEDSILDLFKSCRACSQQCAVRKRVRGLKLVLNQECRFCKNRFEWTNLPDDDDKLYSDFQINGEDAEAPASATASSSSSASASSSASSSSASANTANE